MADHIVKAYDAELETLSRKIAEMGGVAEIMLSNAIETLETLKAEDANAIIATDLRVDGLQREVEDLAVQILARRQPMAIDLREIIVALRVSGDLERVGDLAKNIAMRSLSLSAETGMGRAVIGLKHMGDLASKQLKDVLDAYGRRDVEAAKGVWNRDVELDATEDAVFRDLLTFMMEDAHNISFCTDLLFCSKNVERIGDHATNIAEHIVYLVTGETMPLHRPKGQSRRNNRARVLQDAPQPT